MDTNNFLGMDGFRWFMGVVEDRQDPAQLGRVRVRAFGLHTDNKQAIPTEDLPWATCMHPTTHGINSGIGQSPSFLIEGTWVVGFFLDPELQQPVVMGTMPGIPQNLGDISKGFNDPNERPDEEGVSVYPREAEQSDVDKLARGENTIDKETDQTKDVTIANSTTTWNEPDSAYKATYPYNRVFKTETGHVKEYDDTEGEERIHEYHKSGSFYEIDKDGNKVTRLVKDNYVIVAGDDYVNIKGNVNLTIDSNCNMHVKGNWNIQVDGTKTEVVTGAVSETYKSNQTTNITGTLDLDASTEVDIDAGVINLN